MTANRSDQATVAALLRDLERRVGILEANPIVGSAGSGCLIAGSVYNDGNIILPASDPGFSVVWDTANGYTITFDTPLPVIPVIQLTANNNNPAGSDGFYDASIVNGSPATTGFQVITTEFDGTTADGGFDFACFRPGPGVV